MAIIIKPRTPRVDMHQSIIIDRMGAFWQQLATDEGVPENVLDIELTKFAILSTRADFGGGVDFDLALPADTPEVIRDKFLAYLDTKNIDQIEKANAAIRAKDAPVNSATAPDAPPAEDTKKK